MTNKPAKAPFTFRMSSTTVDQLRELSASSDRRQSEIVRTAVEEYLARQGCSEQTTVAVRSLTFDELQRALPVVQAMGVPVSLKFLLEIIDKQKVRE